MKTPETACVWLVRVASALSVLSACHPTHPSAPVAPEDAAACGARKLAFSEFVAELPSRAVASPTRVNLPVSTFGAVPGNGPLVEVSGTALAVDGEPVTGATAEERSKKFEAWVLGWARGMEATGAPQRLGDRVLYVAAAADLDVHTLRALLVRVPKSVALRLLVRVPAPARERVATEVATSDARDVAARLLALSDPKKRREWVAEAYARFADCPALVDAVRAISTTDPRERWPEVQRAFSDALPRCDCSRLDTTSLRLLVSAEQRAGAATLGWLPLSFMRDERCDASMPLRSMKKLVAELETFDEQFSGGFEEDAMKFADVLVDARLRVNFCDALPGETLAAMARDRTPVYVKSGANGACEPWTFAPMSLGTPMGTVTRAAGKGAPLAFHYWQAAEDLRLYGPVDPSAPSKATDARVWPCETTLHFSGIDEVALRVAPGKRSSAEQEPTDADATDADATDAGKPVEPSSSRWYFDRADCERASDVPPGFVGCVAERAAAAR